jgi:WD40 repeat protein
MTGCHTFAPNGITMAAGTGGAVLLYDLKARRKRAMLYGHKSEVRAVEFSADGERLYSAGDDKKIIHWEPDRMWGKKRKVFEGHESSVVSLAVSPSGKWVASGGLDRSIRIWNSRTGRCTINLTGHQNGVRAVRFVGKSGHLLSVCERGTMFLWDVEAKKVVRRWQPEKSLVHSVAISADGKHVATGLNDGHVALYDLEMALDLEKSMMATAAAR